jgi:hypothetical protein
MWSGKKCWRNDGTSFLCNRHSCSYCDTLKSMYCYCTMEYNNVSNHTLYYYCKMAYSNVYYLTSVTVQFEKTQSKTFLCFMTCTVHSHFTANFTTATHPSLQSRFGIWHNLFSQVMQAAFKAVSFQVFIYALRCTWIEQYHNVSGITTLRVSWGKWNFAQNVVIATLKNCTG